MMKTKQLLLATLLLGALLCAAPASAQDTHTGGVRAHETNGTVSYDFDDDPLAGGHIGPKGTRIQILRGPFRTSLLRPRASFVPELLKSAEDL